MISGKANKVGERFISLYITVIVILVLLVLLVVVVVLLLVVVVVVVEVWCRAQEEFQFLEVGHDAATRLAVLTAHAPCVLSVRGVISGSTHHSGRT